MSERTPEQQRNDRRAGLGCGGLLVLCGVAAVIGGFSLLSDSGIATQARILECQPRLLKMPARCEGEWTVDGETSRGFVDGAGEGDVGKAMDVRVDGDSAKAGRGRAASAIVSFVLAAGLVFLGAAMGRSAWRRRPAG